MPNQRKENKKKVSVWLSPTDLSIVKDVASEYSLTVSDVLKMAIRVLKLHQSRRKRWSLNKM